MGVTTPRELQTQQVHYLRKRITFSNRGTAVEIGWIPTGASVIGGGVHVVTAFNGSGTDLVDVGFVGATTDDNAYATDLDASSVGFKALDELATTTNIQGTQANKVTATYKDANSDATAGIADVEILFVPNNDQ